MKLATATKLSQSTVASDLNLTTDQLNAIFEITQNNNYDKLQNI